MSDTEQIEIYFCQKFNLYQSLPQKKDQNERCVEKFLNGFSDEEVKILKEQSILFFFYDHKDFRFDNYGSMTSKDSHEYEDFKQCYSHEIESIENFSRFEFIIYISSKVALCDNEIFKGLTIAHELQHVLQHIKHKLSIKQARILKKYLKLKNEWTTEKYRNFPTEKDAFRKAKKICYAAFSEQEVDDFIEEKIESLETKINTYKSPPEDLKENKIYWEFIKEIHPEDDYKWDWWIDNDWSANEKKIKEEIDRLKEEKNLLLAYEDYSKTLSEPPPFRPAETGEEEKEKTKLR